MSVRAPRKGENYELSIDLNSGYAQKRKDAIKRVSNTAPHSVLTDMVLRFPGYCLDDRRKRYVSGMFAVSDGLQRVKPIPDVSGLFPDVLKNMQTDDLEQKKLVYLYLMNYAKTQPELVILAVNTFVKDSDDPNPLVRALAIRTMGVLRAEKIIDYLCDPLQKCLRDENPYVRKTAALCVAKLYDLKPELVIENGFLDQLRDMIADSNPMVVANTVAALTDIHIAASAQPSSSTSDPGIFVISASILNKLLIALNECSEWGRVAILNALARYVAQDEKESEHICERVVPQFQHANGSVVLAAMKVVMIHIRGVRREELTKQLVRKMAPPLVTLLSSPPEVQWVALRNINLLLQKRPEILSTEIRVFFCKYNDPLYVKIEKLDIMVRLAADNNVDALLSELKEYASEVDVDFVRKSVKAIGQTAVKIDSAAERCVNVLLELIATRVSYVVQEAVVVMKDIFRKYPSTYEGVIPTLCSNLDELDEPEAKASLIWIIGEYASKIDNADELLNIFVESFVDESYSVQLQTLTAVVKLFLKKPDSSQAIVQLVLNKATKDCDSPDVRDRAYIYWRLLSTDPGAAKAVVLSYRPPISIPRTTVAPALLEELLGEVSNLSSVYHKPAETFVGLGRVGVDSVLQKGAAFDEDQFSARKALQTVAAGQQAENLLDFGDDPVTDGQPSGLAATDVLARTPAAANLMSGMSSNPLDDLVSIFGSASMAAPTTAPAPAVDPLGMNAFGGGAAFGGAASLSPTAVSPPLTKAPQQQPQEDLLGLF
ncbi:AP complex subunit beta [Mycena sanguinolenta]|uniref:AP complex subunit beta n=1 Tax=Mycena sanguinolenta TaxID=230812 RepID=A0A8H7DF98_9AGAR|nr:AP complex subunit beta [Mycena sanguinolenta]